MHRLFVNKSYKDSTDSYTFAQIYKQKSHSMRKCYFLVVVLLLTMQAAFAQGKEVTGRVTDQKDGTPMVGVTVAAVGAKATTKTDVDGRFTLTIPERVTKLRLTSVGFDAVEVNIGDGNITASMKAADAILENLVVTGYKPRSKREFAGSAGTVKGEQIRTTPIASFDQLLQGNTSGISIRANSGQPGNSGVAVIRGRGSLAGSDAPIYVVDGIQVNAADFALINPNDIENISVLKDAVAAAIYGSRGGNGVIVVSTRRGKEGKTTLELDTYLGFSEFPGFRDFRLMNSNEKIDYELRRGGTSLEFYSPAEIDSMRKINTDWEKILTRRSMTRSVNLSVSGGSNKTKYFISGNYYKQEGTLRNTAFDRYTTRFNLTQDAGDFNFGVNATAAFSNYSNTAELNQVISSPLNGLQWSNPYEQEFVPGTVPGTFVRPRTTETGQPIPTTELFKNFNTNKQIRLVASGYAQYNMPFLKGLSAKVLWGVDFNQDETENYADRDTYTGRGQPGGNGFYQQNYFRSSRLTNTNSLNYSTQINQDHSIDAGVYYEFISLKNNNFGYTGYGLTGPLQNISGITQNNSTMIPRLAGTAGEGYLRSVFANLVYGFKNRYFLNLNARRDGSSRFGANKRYANFGGAGLSWIVLDEPFMDKLKNTVFTDLKFKISYGTLGNQEGIGLYQSQNRYIATRSYNGAGTYVQSALANADLQWEQRKKFNVGLEFGLLKGRLTGGFEFYNEVTSNLFLPKELSRTTGFNTLTVNIGSVRNRGMEFSLNYDVIKNRDWKVSIFANITNNRNKILALADRDTIVNSADFTVNIKGQPLNQHYLVEYAGVDPATGSALYRKQDGTTTDVFDEQYRKVVGVWDPPTFGGFGFNADYKGIMLNANFSYFTGSQVYNNERANLENPIYYVDNVASDLANEWQRPGQVTNIPRPDNDFYYETTRFLERNSFVRLRNLSLSYELPRSLLGKAKIKGARFYVQGTNLFTFTQFRGRDPEISRSIVDGAQYPALKTTTIGVRITL
jgi:TonB-dependent starch-binding outer membrane protein SusC